LTAAQIMLWKYSVALFVALSMLTPTASRADGLSAVKSCEADNDPPEEVARLTIMPNGQPRGSDPAAALIKTARQKAKEGKEAEAIQWAALCNFFERSEQEAINSDRVLVLQYLKQ